MLLLNDVTGLLACNLVIEFVLWLAVYMNIELHYFGTFVLKAYNLMALGVNACTVTLIFLSNKLFKEMELALFCRHC